MTYDLSKYKNYIDLYTDAVVIIQDDRIILSNRSAELLIPAIHNKSLVSILETFQPLAVKRMSDISKIKRSLGSMVYPIHITAEKTLLLELTSNFIEVNERPATLTIAKTMNSGSEKMSEAILLQRYLALNQNWVQKGCYIKPLHYVTVNNPKSFYFTFSIGEHHFGWVGALENDLILSSVFIIAMEQYFQRFFTNCDWDHEENLLLDVTEKLLNRVYTSLELSDFMYHIWHLDTKKGFIYLTNNGGPGVLCTSEGEVVDLQDERFNTDNLIKYPIKSIRWLSLGNVEFDMGFIKQYKSDVFLLAEELSNQLYTSGFELQRDLCSVFMDFTFQGTVFEEKFYGVADAQKRIDQLLKKMPYTVDAFTFRLVLMELLTNAYKHGSDFDDTVPIKAIVYINEKELFIEVFDLQSRKERIKIKQSLPLENLLDESGRGLFLVNCYVNNLYLTGNSIIAKITNGVV
ncbi:ATP-binding protein [Fusibacter bizertensis]